MAMELVRQVLITGQLTICSGLLICQIVRPIMSIVPQVVFAVLQISVKSQKKKRIHSQRIQMEIMFLHRFLNIVSFNWLFLLKAYTFFNLLDLPKFYAFFSMLLIASSLTVSISLFPSGSSPSGSAPCEIQKKK